MDDNNTQTNNQQILSGIGGRRGRRGRTSLDGGELLPHISFESAPRSVLTVLKDAENRIFWSIMRFLFSDGFPVSELPATLLAWAETNHPEAFRHLSHSLKDPPTVRRTLAAMYRRMEKDESVPVCESLPDEPDQAEEVSPRRWCDALAEAAANDPVSLEWLTPYIERNEVEMAAVDALDRDYRGQRNELDKRVTERCLR